jgi:hypothetical protein
MGAVVTPTPTPLSETPAGNSPWLLIDGPLFVFPDGSWTVLISALALVVSGLSLAWTLGARSRIHGSVVRNFIALGPKAHPDGDEVVITNVGRSTAIIYDVRAITADERHLKAAATPRGLAATLVPFPELPTSLKPGEVLTVWFGTALAGVDAGIKHGYMITYTDTGTISREGKLRELTVKATDEPAPKVPDA